MSCIKILKFINERKTESWDSRTNVCWARGFRESFAVVCLTMLESIPEKKLEDVYDLGLNICLIILHRLKKGSQVITKNRKIWLMCSYFLFEVIKK